MGFGKHIFIALFALCLFSNKAYAACTSPAGDIGEIEYFTSDDILYFCDGSDWNAMIDPADCTGGPATYTCTPTEGFCSKSGEQFYQTDTMVWCDGNFLYAMGPGGTGAGGCTSPNALAGAINYNAVAVSDPLGFCDGSGWVPIGGLDPSGTISKPDYTPDAFSFPDVNTTQCNKKATSAVVQITGIADGTPVAIDLVNSTAASPQVRNCTTAACAFGSGMPSTSTTVNNNRYLELIGFTGSASSTVTVVVRVGTATATWNIITGVCS